MKNPEYERLLSPTPAEFAALMAETFGPFLHKVATFNVTNFILTSLGHGFDPDGSRLPEWVQETTQPPAADDVEIKSGGFPIAFGKDGLEYLEPPPLPQAKAEKQVQEQAEITEAEWNALKNYTPPLLNVSLARKIKTYLAEGKTDYQIGLLADCKQSYARHYRLALQRAAKNL